MPGVVPLFAIPAEVAEPFRKNSIIPLRETTAGETDHLID